MSELCDYCERTVVECDADSDETCKTYMIRDILTLTNEPKAKMFCAMCKELLVVVGIERLESISEHVKQAILLGILRAFAIVVMAHVMVIQRLSGQILMG